MKLQNLKNDEIIGTIVWAMIFLAICAAVLLPLFGCAATGPSSSATDWRSIHQRSPDTGS